jgi:hypothetical protein
MHELKACATQLHEEELNVNKPKKASHLVFISVHLLLKLGPSTRD